VSVVDEADVVSGSDTRSRIARLLQRGSLKWWFSVGLIGVGGLLLYVSDAVAPAGSWWQSTSDAFGVGFVIGGVVDVLAVSTLTQATLRSRYNREAERIFASANRTLDQLNAASDQLKPPDPQRWNDVLQRSADLLKEHRDDLSPQVRARLQQLVGIINVLL
jgi:hypothetical protein